MQPSITQVDGIFGTADLDHIQWEAYNSQQLSSYQLMQINGDGMPNGTAINRGTGGAYYYNYTKAEWELDLNNVHYIEDTLGWNVVFLRNDAGESGGSYYVCKDDDILKIPDIAQLPTFRVRINSSVTNNNYSYHKQVKPQYRAETVIPIAPIGKSARSNGSILFEYVAIQKKTNGIVIFVIGIDSATIYNEGGWSFPESKQFLQNATDQPIRDLETRLAIVESKVAVLEQTVARHDETLKDLPAIVSAVSANVSKNYVAR